MSLITVYGTSALHVLCSTAPNATLTIGRVEPCIGGPAATVACQLALLGHPARLVGTVGIDAAGRFVRGELVRHGVDTSALIDRERTPRVVALLDGDQLELTADVPAEPVPEVRRWLPGGAEEPTAAGEITYVTGFPDLAPLVRALGEAGRRPVVDVGFIPLLADPPAFLDYVRSLAFAIDVAVFSGSSLPPDDQRRTTDAILGGGASAVLMTLGERGAVVTTRDLTTRLPGHRVEAVDTLCAGDTFVAGYLAATREGRDVVAAARFGQAVAAAKVTLFGGLPTRAAAEALAASSSEAFT